VWWVGALCGCRWYGGRGGRQFSRFAALHSGLRQRGIPPMPQRERHGWGTGKDYRRAWGGEVTTWRGARAILLAYGDRGIRRNRGLGARMRSVGLGSLNYLIVVQSCLRSILPFTP
jgi:hypothetical protein